MRLMPLSIPVVTRLWLLASRLAVAEPLKFFVEILQLHVAALLQVH